MAVYHVGTSGYSYPFWGPSPKYPDIVHNFYPFKNTRLKDGNKNWLSYYATKLDSVEINCTRYRKLTPKMCIEWVKQTSFNPAFTFTIKVGTYFTHSKKLNDPEGWWQETQECVAALGDRFACLLFQFPPTCKKSPAMMTKLQRLKEVIPPHIKCAFEFRDTSWYTADTARFFDDRESWTVVALHLPEVRGRSANFGDLSGGFHYIEMKNLAFVYHRFHGTTSYSCGSYPHDYLAAIAKVYAPSLNRQTSSSLDMCTCMCMYFNNTDTYEVIETEDDIYFAEMSQLIHMPYTLTRAYSQLYPSAIHSAMSLKFLFDVLSS